MTNVGEDSSIYKAKLIVPPSLLTIQVTPNVLSFSYVGERKSFTVTIEGTISVGIVSSSLFWDDGNFQVRSLIVFYIYIECFSMTAIDMKFLLKFHIVYSLV